MHSCVAISVDRSCARFIYYELLIELGISHCGRCPAHEAERILCLVLHQNACLLLPKSVNRTNRSVGFFMLSAVFLLAVHCRAPTC
jgi:hypothetical protein